MKTLKQIINIVRTYALEWNNIERVTESTVMSVCGGCVNIF